MSRKSLCAVVAAAATFLALPAVSGQIFLINFGNTSTSKDAAPNDPVNDWNNVTGAVAETNAGILPNLVTSTGTATTVSLQMVSRFNGNNGNGSTTTTLFPTNATRDSFFGNTGAFGAGPNIFPQFKLTGLDSSTLYTFTFYATRTGVTDNRQTQYDILGATNTVAFIDPASTIEANNITTSAAIAPNASNEIQINISPGPANNNGATRFTYLGVLKIEGRPVPEPTTGVLALAGLWMVARRRRA